MEVTSGLRAFSYGLLASLAAFGVCAQILLKPVQLLPNTIHLENPMLAMGPRPDATGTQLVVVHVNTKPNERHRLVRYFNLGAKCNPTSPLTAVLIEPKHGVLSFAHPKVGPPTDNISGKRMTSFLPAADPRSKCGPGGITAVDIDFTPGAGFAGRDDAQVAVTEHDATIFHSTIFMFQIDVS